MLRSNPTSYAIPSLVRFQSSRVQTAVVSRGRLFTSDTHNYFILIAQEFESTHHCWPAKPAKHIVEPVPGNGALDDNSDDAMAFVPLHVYQLTQIAK